jgi:hypothetical protein
VFWWDREGVGGVMNRKKGKVKKMVETGVTAARILGLAPCCGFQGLYYYSLPSMESLEYYILGFEFG